ncbi:DUF4368 domain-containing protein [Petralouisia muris]|uniref:DUF4368 domain-containing protein n=1 Tax=Petralouisia muris TaxID=3032872 RepID=A0AC61RQP3_9FIRM|nr:DUF4368 domain-containing protein [Petralouisia muris]TGY91361.1 DUF4368 domain-containing protein [Petralouisia muris]
MEKAVWKAAVNRKVNNCVYNWTSDRKTGRLATANKVKSVTSHEVINTIDELTAPLLNELIEKIVVHQSWKDENGKAVCGLCECKAGQLLDDAGRISI